MSLARTRTQTARSGGERTNHEATVVPTPFSHTGSAVLDLDTQTKKNS